MLVLDLKMGDVFLGTVMMYNIHSNRAFREPDNECKAAFQCQGFGRDGAWQRHHGAQIQPAEHTCSALSDDDSIYIYIHAYVYIRVYVYIYIYIYMYVCINWGSFKVGVPKLVLLLSALLFGVYAKACTF